MDYGFKTTIDVQAFRPDAMNIGMVMVNPNQTTGKATSKYYKVLEYFNFLSFVKYSMCKCMYEVYYT